MNDEQRRRLEEMRVRVLASMETTRKVLQEYRTTFGVARPADAMDLKAFEEFKHSTYGFFHAVEWFRRALNAELSEQTRQPE